MTTLFKKSALLAGVMTLSFATAALAAPPPPPPEGGPTVERRVMIMRGGPMGERMGGPMGGMGHHAMDPARHAQHLRDVLQLRPDQEAALQALIAAMTPPESPAGAGHGAGGHDMPMTTPQRLDHHAAMMAEHMAMFQKHATAIRTFYGQLTPAQQKAFDALHGHGMGGMHGGGMPMMGHGDSMMMGEGPH